MFNLRRDPFERADEKANTYWDWILDHAFLIHGMQAVVAQQIDAFAKFAPRLREQNVATSCGPRRVP